MSDRARRKAIVVRLLSCAAAVCALALGGRASGQAAPSADLASWMAGCWRSAGVGRSTVETWMAPEQGMMMGMSRTLQAGQIRSYELLLLHLIEGRLAYEAHPSGQEPASFPVVRLTADELRVENAEHDFPQAITYRRVGADSLFASVFGSVADESPASVFRYGRCESADDPPSGRASRAVQLPDTMGADFSIADSASATSGPDDFDFLIGVWQFDFQQRRQDGTFNPPFPGHWVFDRKDADGAMIEDHWRADQPDRTYDAGTWTYRTFNPARKLWEMQGVNTASGAWQPGLMWRDGDSRLVIEHYGDTIMRFRYFAIEPDHFLWRADQSTDGGRSWFRDWWTMDVRRVAR